MKKSQLVGFILTFLFGPIGLFYSSVPAAFGFIVAAIGFGFATGGIAVFFIWIISIFVTFTTVSSYNSKIEVEERRHNELRSPLESEMNYFDKMECPYCAEIIKIKAKICKHCNGKLQESLSETST